LLPKSWKKSIRESTRGSWIYRRIFSHTKKIFRGCGAIFRIY
jgi:hypothetical protein